MVAGLSGLICPLDFLRVVPQNPCLKKPVK